LSGRPWLKDLVQPLQRPGVAPQRCGACQSLQVLQAAHADDRRRDGGVGQGPGDGDCLCFWDTIDEQHTLPLGRADDVRREIRERLRTIGASGGLILGPAHHVQLDTPYAALAE
jgi:hypothetical protein